MVKEGSKGNEWQDNAKDWQLPVRPRRFSQALRLSGIALCIASGILAAVAISWMPEFLLKLEASGWPNVPGVIESIRVVKTAAGRNGTDYRAEIAYKFTVSSVERRSTNVSPVAQFGGGQAAADELCARYPVGQPVTVWHHPQQQNQSMLEPGLDWSLAARLLFMVPPFILVSTAIVSWFILLLRRIGGRAPGGLRVFTEPLPRLRTLRFPPAAIGAMSGGGTGLLTMTLAGLLADNYSSPLAIVGSLVVMLVIWTIFWRFFRNSNLHYRHDIIVDSERSLLVLPGLRGVPRTLAVTAWNALCLTSEIPTNSKGYIMLHKVVLERDVEPGEPGPFNELVYVTVSAPDAAEVASWVSQQTGLPIYRRPEKR